MCKGINQRHLAHHRHGQPPRPSGVLRAQGEKKSGMPPTKNSLVLGRVSNSCSKPSRSFISQAGTGKPKFPVRKTYNTPSMATNPAPPARYLTGTSLFNHARSGLTSVKTTKNSGRTCISLTPRNSSIFNRYLVPVKVPTISSAPLTKKYPRPASSPPQRLAAPPRVT